MATENNHSKYFLIGAILIFVGLLGLLLSRFLTPLVLGLFLAALSYPWFKKIKELLNDSKNTAALFTLFVIITIIIIPVIFISILFFQELLNLFLMIQEQATNNSPAFQMLTKIIHDLNLDAEMIREQIISGVRGFGTQLINSLSSIFSNIFQLIIGFFIMLVTIFYFLRDGKILGEILIKASPLKTEDELYIYQTFKEAIRAVFYGNFLSALSQGILGGLGFWIFGVGSPILWAAIMTFLSLIPLLGPYIIFLPATAYLLIIGKTGTAIGFLIYNFLLVSTVDNIIKPQFIGGKIKVHPFLILLSILGGLSSFGILGIIYGPLIVVLTFIFIEIYNRSNK